MKKIISLILVIVMTLSLSTTIFATNDYTSGTDVAYEAQGQEAYTITVPAHLAPGTRGTVTAQGTWASNRVLNVTAQEKVTLTNNIKATDQKILDVTFAGINKAGSNTEEVIATETVSVSAIADALFGTWSGRFYYNVEMETISLSIPVQSTDKNGNDLNATSTEIVGSEKEVLLDKLEESGIVDNQLNVDALIEVKSDDFDDLAETTFDVSSIAQPGDKVIIVHYDETKQEWEYIGEGIVKEDGTVTENFSSYSPVGFIVVKDDGTVKNSWPVYFGKYYELVGSNSDSNSNSLSYADGFVFYPDGSWFAYWEDEITDNAQQGIRLTYVGDNLCIGEGKESIVYATLSEDRKILTLLTGKQLVLCEDPELVYNQPYYFTPYGTTDSVEAMSIIIRENNVVELYDANNVYQGNMPFEKISNKVWFEGDTLPSVVISDSGTILFTDGMTLVCPVNSTNIHVGAEYSYYEDSVKISVIIQDNSTFKIYMDDVESDGGTYLIKGDLLITSMGACFAISNDGNTLTMLSPDRNNIILNKTV